MLSESLFELLVQDLLFLCTQAEYYISLDVLKVFPMSLCFLDDMLTDGIDCLTMLYYTVAIHNVSIRGSHHYHF